MKIIYNFETTEPQEFDLSADEIREYLAYDAWYYGFAETRHKLTPKECEELKKRVQEGVMKYLSFFDEDDYAGIIANCDKDEICEYFADRLLSKEDCSRWRAEGRLDYDDEDD